MFQIPLTYTHTKSNFFKDKKIFTKEWFILLIEINSIVELSGRVMKIKRK